MCGEMDLDLTGPELDAAWDHVMRNGPTIEAIMEVRRALAECPHLRLREPSDEDLELTRLAVVAAFGEIPGWLDVRSHAIQWRICAELQALRLAKRRRAAAGDN